MQLLHGPVGQGDELAEPDGGDRSPHQGTDADGAARYEGSFACDTGPAATASPRGCCPATPDLASPVELGRITWA